jgi:hypothetical protein
MIYPPDFRRAYECSVDQLWCLWSFLGFVREDGLADLIFPRRGSSNAPRFFFGFIRRSWVMINLILFCCRTPSFHRLMCLRCLRNTSPRSFTITPFLSLSLPFPSSRFEISPALTPRKSVPLLCSQAHPSQPQPSDRLLSVLEILPCYSGRLHSSATDPAMCPVPTLACILGIKPAAEQHSDL